MTSSSLLSSLVLYGTRAPIMDSLHYDLGPDLGSQVLHSLNQMKLELLRACQYDIRMRLVQFCVSPLRHLMRI